jgi:N-acetylglutamate synthase-like GNAT family acetyltransferase
MKYRIIKADERHRAEIDRLIKETRIGEGFEADRPVRHFWLAKMGERIVGCAGLFYFNGVAILTHVAVEADLRKHGVGGALVDKAFADVKQKGVKAIALITMYYRFKWFKKWGFRTSPRADLPEHIRCFPDFTSKRYMKCAVMLNDKI